MGRALYVKGAYIDTARHRRCADFYGFYCYYFLEIITNMVIL